MVMAKMPPVLRAISTDLFREIAQYLRGKKVSDTQARKLYQKLISNDIPAKLAEDRSIYLEMDALRSLLAEVEAENATLKAKLSGTQPLSERRGAMLANAFRRYRQQIDDLKDAIARLEKMREKQLKNYFQLPLEMKRELEQILEANAGGDTRIKSFLRELKKL